MKRRNLVINSMLEDGKITAQDSQHARDQPLQLKLAHDPNSLAPYYVEDIRRYLENKYGTDAVHAGGLRACTPRSTWICSASPTKPCSMAWRPTNAATGGEATCPTCLTKDVTLENYHDPDWDDEPGSQRLHPCSGHGGFAGSAKIRFGNYTATLAPADMAWTHRKLHDSCGPGTCVYVKILSLDPDDKDAS